MDTNPTTNTTTAPESPPAASTPQPDDANAAAGQPASHNPFRDSTVAPVPVTAAQPASSTPPVDATSNAPTGDAPVPQRPRESPVDPRVVALRAMFPDYDDLILQSVLESVGGNQDRAIDALLGMSDPDYRSEQPPAAAPLSQTELDEQLARRLMIEEQDAQQAAWQAQEAQRAQQHPRPPSNQQYPNQQYSGQNTGAPSSGDTVGEFQQQFNKIAETGKKTFGTIFSKVKAKIQEFDQPKTGQGSNPANQPTWGGSGGYDPYQSQQAPQGQQQPYLARPQSHQSPQLPPQQQPAYYDPNAYTQHSASPSPPITLSSTRPAPPGIQGYDVTPDAPAQTRSVSPPGAAPVSSTEAINATTTTPTTDAPRPPQTGSGLGQAAAPIDGGKLGLLPKRPVSLLRSQSPPAAAGTPSAQQVQSRASEDDSDGLEYAENPFEEGKK